MNKIQLFGASVFTVVLAAFFYYIVIDPHVAPVKSLGARESFDETVRAAYEHPLSGRLREEPAEFFAISVMVDNFNDVRMQPGLESALIIYEALAEGNITRLLAIFDSTQNVSTFGPIRSVRPYFIDWASEYGGILMHVGGSPAGLDATRASDALIAIDQIGAFEDYFRRDDSLPSPHNVFSMNSSWLQIGERFAIENAAIKPWRYVHDEMVNNDTATHGDGVATHQVEIAFFSDNEVGWVYNREKNNYVRFVNGERQFFTTGEQIFTDNIVIIEVESEVTDPIGRRSMKTLGTGRAHILTRGATVDAQWIKDSPQSRMRFIGTDQEEVAFASGVTWIEVVPSLEIVEYTELGA